MNHLHQELQVLQDNSLHLNPEKCEFGCCQLEFLGHWISYQGVKIHRSKIDHMLMSIWAIQERNGEKHREMGSSSQGRRLRTKRMKKSQRKGITFRVSSDPFIGSDTAGSCVTLLMRSHV